MAKNDGIVSWDKGKRLVGVDGRAVTIVEAREEGGKTKVYETVDEGEARLLFAGEETDAAKVLDLVARSFQSGASGGEDGFSPRNVVAIGACVVVLTMVATAAVLTWQERSRLYPRLTADRYAAAPGAAQADGADEGSSSFLAAGNDRAPGMVSSNGATGASIAPTHARPSFSSPDGKAPDLPALPKAAPSALEAAGAKPVMPGDVPQSDVPGIGGRAADAAARNSAATSIAKAEVARQGTDSAQKELDDLKKALAKLGKDEKLPPEFVRQLPHDLAERLQESGVVESPEETATRMSGSGAKYAIVRLPAEVLEKYVDRDGVSTIPSENSWVTTGGNVVIPLPGGGEIKKPSDLALFHLQGG